MLSQGFPPYKWFEPIVVGREPDLEHVCRLLSHLCLTVCNAFSSFSVAHFGLEITPDTSWITLHVNAQKQGKAGPQIDPHLFRPTTTDRLAPEDRIPSTFSIRLLK